MSKRGYSDQERTLILEYYNEGHTLKETAEAFDRTWHQVWYVVGRRNDRRRKHVQALPDDAPEQMAQRWDAGQSAERIGRDLGVKPDTVRRHLVSLGRTVEKRYNAGDRHPGWKGGRTVHRQGYVWVRVAVDDPRRPRGYKGPYMMEHRLVMAEALGRALEDHETVHHINGDRMDNRRENLQLRNGRHGKGSAFRCLDCGSHNIAAIPITAS